MASLPEFGIAPMRSTEPLLEP
uniref:Uncharacterized protein n=1 Tax=Anguilla anguilla TaxID=7936 RepID=A0A0E9SFB6_ANGAN